MSQWLQADAIAALRTEISDDLYGKVIVGFQPLVGVLDGNNQHFQIPQDRVVAATVQLFKNNVLLAQPGDYSFTDLLAGFSTQGLFAVTLAPEPSDSFAVTFNFVWYTDLELDHLLNRAANEFTQSSYHTDGGFGETIAVLPTDIPDGMKAALTLLAAYRAARALAQRFAVKYDTSASDQSWSPSSVAKSYSDMATQLRKDSTEARDDFYKGQGRQYRPSIRPVGYVLPNWTPRG